jgi:hypothetical protein
MVVVEGTAYRVLTDSAGGYVLRIPEQPGRVLRLRIGAIGYAPAARSVAQTSGEIDVDVSLADDVIGLMEVVADDRPARDERHRVGYHVTRIEGSKP